MEPDSTNPLPGEPPSPLPPPANGAPRAIPLFVPWARPAAPPSARTPTGMDLLVALALIWGFELVAGFGFVVALAGTNAAAEVTTLFSPYPVFALAVTALSLLFALIVSWYFLCHKYRKPFTEGFALHAVRLRSILVSVLLAAGGMLVGVCVLDGQEPDDSPLAHMVSTPLGALAFMAWAVIVPPLEELYYRGFLYPVLEKYIGTVAAIIIVSAWFAAMHAIQLRGAWMGLAVVAAMGTLFTLQRCLTRSLVPSILTHWLYNALVVFVAPFLVTP